jgi:Mg2+/citrate symporter
LIASYREQKKKLQAFWCVFTQRKPMSTRTWAGHNTRAAFATLVGKLDLNHQVIRVAALGTMAKMRSVFSIAWKLTMMETKRQNMSAHLHLQIFHPDLAVTSSFCRAKTGNPTIFVGFHRKTCFQQVVR